MFMRRNFGSGIGGYGFETSVKALLGKEAEIAPAGKTDLRYGKHYEIKTGAGTLDYTGTGKAMCYGSSMVIYAPVVPQQASFTVDELKAVEAFVMPRKLFLETLESLGMIRHKVSTAGQDVISIQTFWNHSKNAPHGAKYSKMLDAFYDLVDEGSAQTFAEWVMGE